MHVSPACICLVQADSTLVYAPPCYVFTYTCFPILIYPCYHLQTTLDCSTSYLLLSLYHPNLQSFLVLSSGGLLIILSVMLSLSCTIILTHKVVVLVALDFPIAYLLYLLGSQLAVYKLYYYST